MSYVSFNDVIELNGILKDKGLNFRIHLRDTCGRQSFWSFPNKRILRNNLCLPACKQKNIATKLRDTA